MIKVVSIDGGGLKGLVPALYLARNEHVTAGAKLFAGTSTGGLISLALAADISPAVIARLYKVKGPDIFHKGPLFFVKKLLRAKYSAKPLEAALWEVFGGMHLSELKTDVLITTSEYTRRRNEEGLQFFDRYSPYLVFDAARATSAAPTYFMPHEVDGHVYLDGGLVSNSPADCALTEAIKLWGSSEDFHVISIGTGIDPATKKPRVKRTPWSYLDDIIGLGIGGNVGKTDTVLKNASKGMPGLTYTRIDFDMGDRLIDMDDARPKTIAYLESRAADEHVCIWENGVQVKGKAA